MTRGGDRLPSAGRLAGIDYGQRRVGIAVCDASRIIASPHEVHEAGGDAAAEADYYRHLARGEDLVGFVVGLPIHADGNASRMSVAVERFASWLRTTTGLPVAFQDERYTSREAAGLLARSGLTRGRRRERSDAIAAQIILTAWLESGGDTSAAPGALDG